MIWYIIAWVVIVVLILWVNKGLGDMNKKFDEHMRGK